MSDCMIVRRWGGLETDFVVCAADRHTVHLTTWAESKASLTYGAHTITPEKISNSDGGAGFCTAWAVDLTAYKSLVMDVSLSDIRSTTNVNYMPMFGAALSKPTGINSTINSKVLLVQNGETSLGRGVYTLDVSALIGEYYLCYKGIATGTIYDFRLKK